MSTLGDIIREVRGRRDWSQHDLAAASGVTQNTISVIERGGRVGAFATIARLALALDLDLNALARALVDDLDAP